MADPVERRPVVDFMATHPNCRCVMVPKTKSWTALGYPEVDAAIRDGQFEEATPIIPGEQLLKSFPREAQKRTLGRGRHALWRGSAGEPGRPVPRSVSPGLYGLSLNEMVEPVPNAEWGPMPRPVSVPGLYDMLDERGTWGPIADRADWQALKLHHEQVAYPWRFKAPDLGVFDFYANPAPTSYDNVVETVRRQTEGYGPEPAGLGQSVEFALREYLSPENADLRIRVPLDALGQIITDGRLKTQHETGTSRGSLDPYARRETENRMFGYPDTLPGELRPIYGYVAQRDHEKGSARHYGDVVIRLKPDVRRRTTIMVGDSLLEHDAAPSPIDSPRAYSARRRTWDRIVDNGPDAADTYVEMQVHGRVTLRDIEEVVFTRRPVSISPDSPDPGSIDILAPLQVALTARNIPWREVDSPDAIGRPYHPVMDATIEPVPNFDGFVNWERIALVDQAHREWLDFAPPDRNFATLHGMSPEAYLDAVDRHLRDITSPAKAELRMRVPSEAIGSILDDGRFVTQHETDTSRGMYDPAVRRDAEERMFGIDDAAPASYRPIYGYISSIDGETAGVGSYGDVVVRLRNEVRERTSISFGDSLAHSDRDPINPDRGSVPDRVMPQWAETPYPLDKISHVAVPVDAQRILQPFAEAMKHEGHPDGFHDPLMLDDVSDGPLGGFGYAEAQFHKGLQLSDIAELVFTQDPPHPRVIDRLRRLRIRWRSEPAWTTNRRNKVPLSTVEEVVAPPKVTPRPKKAPARARFVKPKPIPASRALTTITSPIRRGTAEAAGTYGPQVNEAARESVQRRIEGDVAEYAKKRRMTVSQYKAAVETNLRAKLSVDKTALGIRMTEGRLEGILGDGRILPGNVDERRAQVEADLFGVPTDAPMTARPIYAYVLSKGATFDQSTASHYGDILIRLHDDVRSRTTITGSDSFDMAVDRQIAVPSPIDEPSYDSMRYRRLGAGNKQQDPASPDFGVDFGGASGKYTEAQVHGPVRLRDIAEVVFTGEGPSLPVIRLLDAKGVSWRVADRGDVLTPPLERRTDIAPPDPRALRTKRPAAPRRNASQIRADAIADLRRRRESESPGRYEASIERTRKKLKMRRATIDRLIEQADIRARKGTAEEDAGYTSPVRTLYARPGNALEGATFDAALAARDVIAEALGVYPSASSWNGLLSVRADYARSGAFDEVAGTFIARRATIESIPRRIALATHEMLHSFSHHNPREYVANPGWEEGLAEALSRELAPAVALKLGFEGDPYAQADLAGGYIEYRAPLREIAKLVGDDDDRGFYVRLMKERLSDRRRVVQEMADEIGLNGADWQQLALNVRQLDLDNPTDLGSSSHLDRYWKRQGEIELTVADYFESVREALRQDFRTFYRPMVTETRNEVRSRLQRAMFDRAFELRRQQATGEALTLDSTAAQLDMLDQLQRALLHGIGAGPGSITPPLPLGVRGAPPDPPGWYLAESEGAYGPDLTADEVHGFSGDAWGEQLTFLLDPKHLYEPRHQSEWGPGVYRARTAAVPWNGSAGNVAYYFRGVAVAAQLPHDGVVSPLHRLEAVYSFAVDGDRRMIPGSGMVHHLDGVDALPSIIGDLRAAAVADGWLPPRDAVPSDVYDAPNPGGVDIRPAGEWERGFGLADYIVVPGSALAEATTGQGVPPGPFELQLRGAFPANGYRLVGHADERGYLEALLYEASNGGRRVWTREDVGLMGGLSFARSLGTFMDVMGPLHRAAVELQESASAAALRSPEPVRPPSVPESVEYFSDDADWTLREATTVATGTMGTLDNALSVVHTRDGVGPGHPGDGTLTSYAGGVNSIYWANNTEGIPRWGIVLDVSSSGVQVYRNPTTRDDAFHVGMQAIKNRMRTGSTAGVLHAAYMREFAPVVAAVDPDDAGSSISAALRTGDTPSWEDALSWASSTGQISPSVNHGAGYTTIFGLGDWVLLARDFNGDPVGLLFARRGNMATISTAPSASEQGLIVVRPGYNDSSVYEGLRRTARERGMLAAPAPTSAPDTIELPRVGTALMPDVERVQQSALRVHGEARGLTSDDVSLANSAVTARGPDGSFVAFGWYDFQGELAAVWQMPTNPDSGLPTSAGEIRAVDWLGGTLYDQTLPAMRRAIREYIDALTPTVQTLDTSPAALANLMMLPDPELIDMAEVRRVGEEQGLAGQDPDLIGWAGTYVLSADGTQVLIGVYDHDGDLAVIWRLPVNEGGLTTGTGDLLAADWMTRGRLQGNGDVVRALRGSLAEYLSVVVPGARPTLPAFTPKELFTAETEITPPLPTEITGEQMAAINELWGFRSESAFDDTYAIETSGRIRIAYYNDSGEVSFIWNAPYANGRITGPGESFVGDWFDADTAVEAILKEARATGRIGLPRVEPVQVLPGEVPEVPLDEGLRRRSAEMEDIAEGFSVPLHGVEDSADWHEQSGHLLMRYYDGDGDLAMIWQVPHDGTGRLTGDRGQLWLGVWLDAGEEASGASQMRAELENNDFTREAGERAAEPPVVTTVPNALGTVPDGTFGTAEFRHHADNRGFDIDGEFDPYSVTTYRGSETFSFLYADADGDPALLWVIPVSGGTATGPGEAWGPGWFRNSPGTADGRAALEAAAAQDGLFTVTPTLVLTTAPDAYLPRPAASEIDVTQRVDLRSQSESLMVGRWTSTWLADSVEQVLFRAETTLRANQDNLPRTGTGMQAYAYHDAQTGSIVAFMEVQWNGGQLHPQYLMDVAGVAAQDAPLVPARITFDAAVPASDRARIRGRFVDFLNAPHGTPRYVPSDAPPTVPLREVPPPATPLRANWSVQNLNDSSYSEGLRRMASSTYYADPIPDIVPGEAGRFGFRRQLDGRVTYFHRNRMGEIDAYAVTPSGRADGASTAPISDTGATVYVSPGHHEQNWARVFEQLAIDTIEGDIGARLPNTIADMPQVFRELSELPGPEAAFSEVMTYILDRVDTAEDIPAGVESITSGVLTNGWVYYVHSNGGDVDAALIVPQAGHARLPDTAGAVWVSPTAASTASPSASLSHQLRRKAQQEGIIRDRVWNVISTQNHASWLGQLWTIPEGNPVMPVASTTNRPPSYTRSTASTPAASQTQSAVTMPNYGQYDQFPRDADFDSPIGGISSSLGSRSWVNGKPNTFAFFEWDGASWSRGNREGVIALYGPGGGVVSYVWFAFDDSVAGEGQIGRHGEVTAVHWTKTHASHRRFGLSTRVYEWAVLNGFNIEQQSGQHGLTDIGSRYFRGRQSKPFSRVTITASRMRPELGSPVTYDDAIDMAENNPTIRDANRLLPKNLHDKLKVQFVPKNAPRSFEKGVGNWHRLNRNGETVGIYEDSVEPSFQLELDPTVTVSLDTVDLAGAYAVRYNKQDSVISWVTGNAVARLGVETNGNLYRVELGRLDDGAPQPLDFAERREVFEVVRAHFPMATFDPIEGVIEFAAYATMNDDYARKIETLARYLRERDIAAKADMIPAHIRWYWHDQATRDAASDWFNPPEDGSSVVAEGVIHRLRGVDSRADAIPARRRSPRSRGDGGKGAGEASGGYGLDGPGERSDPAGDAPLRARRRMVAGGGPGGLVPLPTDAHLRVAREAAEQVLTRVSRETGLQNTHWTGGVEWIDPADIRTAGIGTTAAIMDWDGVLRLNPSYFGAVPDARALYILTHEMMHAVVTSPEAHYQFDAMLEEVVAEGLARTVWPYVARDLGLSGDLPIRGYEDMVAPLEELRRQYLGIDSATFYTQLGNLDHTARRDWLVAKFNAANGVNGMKALIGWDELVVSINEGATIPSLWAGSRMKDYEVLADWLGPTDPFFWRHLAQAPPGEKRLEYLVDLLERAELAGDVPIGLDHLMLPVIEGHGGPLARANLGRRMVVSREAAHGPSTSTSTRAGDAAARPDGRGVRRRAGAAGRVDVVAPRRPRDVAVRQSGRADAGGGGVDGAPQTGGGLGGVSAAEEEELLMVELGLVRV